MTEDNKQNTATTKKLNPTRTREEIHPEVHITYNESNHAIPEDVIKRFKAQGYALRWIRYRMGEKEDYANISKKLRHGWSFVTPDEVPELGAATQMMSFGRYTDLVTVEDVALAKCRIKHVKQLQDLKHQRAYEQMKAEEDKINKAGFDIKELKSKTTYGTRKPTFEDSNDTDSEL